MKTLAAVIIACLLSVGLVGQQIVNVELTAQSATNCQITLYPTLTETSVLSNVVFTLKWRSSRNIAFNNPPSNSLIAIARSGPVRTSGGWRYQTFSGCGLVAGLIGQPIVLNIPRSGSGVISIASDPFVDQLTVNGRYFVSIGGVNVTGSEITTAKSLQLIGDEPIITTMVYDPTTNQFYISRDGVYYNMVGQRAVITNTAELIVVRKSEL